MRSVAEPRSCGPAYPAQGFRPGVPPLQAEEAQLGDSVHVCTSAEGAQRPALSFQQRFPTFPGHVQTHRSFLRKGERAGTKLLPLAKGRVQQRSLGADGRGYGEGRGPEGSNSRARELRGVAIRKGAWLQNQRRAECGERSWDQSYFLTREV